MSGDLSLLAHYAMRYALGRRSTAPSDVCAALRRQWPDIDPGTRDLIASDIDDAAKRDRQAEHYGWKYRRLGDACDRRTWLDFREWMDRQ